MGPYSAHCVGACITVLSGPVISSSRLIPPSTLLTYRTIPSLFIDTRYSILNPRTHSFHTLVGDVES